MKKRVLILCTGNSCRSQMAEGWIRHDLGDRVDVFSAGTRPEPVTPHAIRVMAEVGVDISGHICKHYSRFLGEPMDLVVTVCDAASQECPIFPGARKLVHEPIPDPYPLEAEGDGALAKYREARDLIRDRIVSLVRRELLD